MPYRTCDHLKEDGVYCASPALRDQRYCYFHLNIRAHRVQAARARLHDDPRRFQMPSSQTQQLSLARVPARPQSSPATVAPSPASTDGRQGAPEPALSLSKGSPFTNLGEVPDVSGTVPKPPTATCPAAVDAPADAA